MHSKLRDMVDAYVDNHRWDTLIGRSWDMTNEDSREEFKQFLVKRIEESGLEEHLRLLEEEVEIVDRELQRARQRLALAVLPDWPRWPVDSRFVYSDHTVDL